MTNTGELEQVEVGMETRGRRRNLLLPILIIIVLLLGAAALAYLKYLPRTDFPESLAIYAPPESVVYFSLDARPIIKRSKEFEPLVKAWKESSINARLKAALEEELKAGGISFDKDILPWLGPMFGFALSDLNMPVPSPARLLDKALPDLEKMPAFLAMLTTRDARLARASLAKIAQKSGLKTGEKTSYGGFELAYVRPKGSKAEFIYTVTDNMVFISNRVQQVKAALDRLKGKGAQLAAQEAYKKVVATQTIAPKEQVLTCYVSVQGYMQGIQSLLADSGVKLPDSYNEQLKYVDAFGGGVSVEPKSIKMELLAWGKQGAENPMLKVMSKLPSVGGRAFQFLPKQTSVAITGQSPALQWSLVKPSMMQANPQFKETWQQAGNALKKACGLDLEQDLIGWMTGEFSLGVFDIKRPALGPDGMPMTMPVELAIVIEGKSDAIVKAKVAKIRNAVQNVINARGLSMPVWSAQETKGVAYHSLMLPLPIPLSVSLAQVGKLAIITTTQGAMKRVIAAGLDSQASITANPSYQQAKGTFAMRPQSIFFAEPSVIAQEFPEVLGMGLLEGIKRMVFSGYLLPQGSRSIGRVDVDFPTLINGLDQAVVMASVMGNMGGTGRRSPGVSSQQAACLSNEKQIALAMLMFAGDHDGTLPKADTWQPDILPYIGNANILQCPSDISGAKCSYAMNAALSGKKSREIANLGQTVLLFESAKPGLVTSGRAADVAAPPRHSGGNCFAFADGHARCQKATPEF